MRSMLRQFRDDGKYRINVITLLSGRTEPFNRSYTRDACILCLPTASLAKYVNNLTPLRSTCEWKYLPRLRHIVM